VPLTATNWEVEVEFKISGKNQLFGDGFAMWVTRQRGQQGSVFGHTDNFEGLGVFFDTYKNNRPGVVFPYVSAMIGDGQTSYDKASDGKSTELAGCSARGIRHSNTPTKFRLTYFQDKQLKLELQYKNEIDWQVCFDVESPPTIPNISYLGFSAETGELSDNHDIIAIRARNLYTSPSVSGSKSKPGGGNRAGSGTGKGSNSRGNRGGGWLWFLIKIFLFAMVLTLAYVGFTAYRARSKSHHF
jgi:lectin, mannose-binding 2